MNAVQILVDIQLACPNNVLPNLRIFREKYSELLYAEHWFQMNSHCCLLSSRDVLMLSFYSTSSDSENTEF